jgi:polyhydroxybutyrate depolymerase
MASFTQLDEEAIIGSFIVVYPDSVGGVWNAGACCGDAAKNRVDDVGFIKSLVDRLANEYNIDKARVFATGVSAGALMAYRLACDLASRISAIASVAGVMVTEDCRPNRPVSILEMHGTADTLIPYAGGRNPDPGDDLKYLLSTAAVIQTWAKLDGCSGKPAETTDGVTKTSTWTACRARTAVRLDTIVGGHHVWFGFNQGLPPPFDSVPGEPNSNTTIWGFFSSLAPRT